MIGGGGEKKTLRLVAQYAQACNLFNTPDLEHKLDVLKQHCEDEGRDYDEITKTVYQSLDIGENGEKTNAADRRARPAARPGLRRGHRRHPATAALDAVERIGTDVIPAAAEF